MSPREDTRTRQGGATGFERERGAAGFQRTGGRRTARLVADRRRRRARRRRGLLAAAALAAVAVAVLAFSRVEPDPGPSAGEDTVPVAGEDGYTLLLVRHTEDVGRASSITLLAGGAADGPSLVLFLPTGTLVDIPGVGTDRLGLAYQYGSAPLLQATVENLLGISVDHTALVSESGLAALLDRLDGLRVDVPARLVTWHDDGRSEVRFEPGEQFLDGPRLAEYWSFRARGDDELDALARQRQVLDALIAGVADPEAASTLLGDGAPQLQTGADGEWLTELASRLAAARQADRLRYTPLPVEPFGGDGPDGEGTYRVRQEALAEMTEGVLAASVPGGGTPPVRVQVLNGVGVPGVGQRVDERLDGGHFRIVVTDNARNFEFPQTQILVYDESDESMVAARQVRDLLGVGTIQVSRQPQSVVDLTIVVGADFLAADGRDAETP